ncbi:LemA family protein [Pelagibius sp.]|uniref:LemA family protein n=1 Tax=Pelagibius sp. TaxID=1931238 RepID=UPI003B50C43F
MHAIGRLGSRLLFCSLLASLLAACGVNDIPTHDEAVKANWAQVENQYKRRADLIPNLVEVVKGFAAQERETLTAVVEARAKATQMQIPSDILSNPEAFRLFEANQGAITQALSRLLLVVERYPDLKSNQNFLSLQAQLEGTENRIAVARRDYIQAVQTYNTELRTFPGRIWATLLYSDMQLRETFSQPEAVAEPPTVSFN